MKKIIVAFGVVVIAVMMFFSANNVNSYSSNTNLASLITINTANAEPDDAGGSCSGIVKDFWHKDSYVNSAYSKISPSNPVSSSATAVNGSLSVAPNKSVSVGGGVCSNKTYNITIIHYECELDFASQLCPQKEEYTAYSYN
ncbi:hypothetical protein SAMN05192550_3111 [Flavobacterium glycines]|uniref:Uncharacterized protein n=1 Tax=Flavobacterium glycines TaxID=551990 RepID=A0A1B9DT51_9FLAO|nr:hypothetical protein [Flavobacterium glycines]OCB72883.1 hypothetical protein FBGL_04490 [Flavobacterium glycines]GEL12135.1 hypothetical protein FGL01_28740 [Flavobacterium glycines]SDJ97328.1 hypothetical protein SAMN05192550_3111 [Flavobacterium glycines]